MPRARCRRRGWSSALLPRLAASDADAVWITRVPDGRAAGAGRGPGGACRRRSAARSGACRSRSRTISTSPACRPPPPARTSPTRPTRVGDRWSSGCSPPARSWSARPTSTSSRPGLVGVRSPYGVARNPFDAAFVPGGSSSGSARGGGGGPGQLRARHRHGGLRPRAGGVQQHRRPQADQGPDPDPGRGARLPLAGLRLDLRAHRRRCRCRAGGRRRLRPGRPVLARGAAAARAAASPASRLGVLERRSSASSSATRRPRRIYDAALARPSALGAELVEVDLAPFLDAAELLYAGPWVAERTAAVGEFLAAQPGRVLADHPGRDRDRPPVQRGRRVQRPVPAGRARARRAPRLGADRRAAAADHTHDLPGRRARGRADPAQQPAGHLHQLRQPARPLRAGAAGRASGRTACRWASR